MIGQIESSKMIISGKRSDLSYETCRNSPFLDGRKFKGSPWKVHTLVVTTVAMI